MQTGQLEGLAGRRNKTLAMPCQRWGPRVRACSLFFWNKDEEEEEGERKGKR